MKIGVNSMVLENDFNLNKAIKIADELGFDNYEIDIGLKAISESKKWNEAKLEWDKEMKNIKNMSIALNIGFKTMCLGVLWCFSLASSNQAEQNQGIKIILDALNWAELIGTKYFLIPVGHPKELTKQQAKANLIKLLENTNVIKKAEESGVTLCLENVCQKVLYTAEDLVEVIDHFKSDNLKVYYDVGNQLFIDLEPYEEISKLGKRIACVHLKDIKDGERVGKGIPPSMVTGDFSIWNTKLTVNIGKGRLNYGRIKKKLEEIGYAGNCTIEISQEKGKGGEGAKYNLMVLRDLGF